MTGLCIFLTFVIICQFFVFDTTVEGKKSYVWNVTFSQICHQKRVAYTIEKRNIRSFNFNLSHRNGHKLSRKIWRNFSTFLNDLTVHVLNILWFWGNFGFRNRCREQTILCFRLTFCQIFHQKCVAYTVEKSNIETFDFKLSHHNGQKLLGKIWRNCLYFKVTGLCMFWTFLGFLAIFMFETTVEGKKFYMFET